MNKLIAFISMTLAMIQCQQPIGLDSASFTQGSPNKSIELVTLENKSGCIAQFTNYGGRWVSMYVPDTKGKLEDVILGFSNINGYINAREPYHGAITGRVCGRIDQGKTTIGLDTIYLNNNDLFGYPTKNHLHGGIEGFHKKIWSSHTGKDSNYESYVEYHYLSPDGEEGYPGNLDVKVRYTLTNSNTIRIQYWATTDKSTLVNLTNHVFFNLSGDASNSVNGHTLLVNSSSYLPCNKELIPTGEISEIKGTPLDFTTHTPIATYINYDHPDIIKGKGYAVAYKLKNGKNNELNFAAQLKEPSSGRVLDVYTNQVSLQFYNAWLMDGTDIGKGKIPYKAAAGLVLESQGMPDAPNHSNFSSIQLDTNDTYYHIVEYQFSVEK